MRIISISLLLLLQFIVSIRTINVDIQKLLRPPADEAATMARYIVNKAEWASMATYSTRENTKDLPFVSLVTISDGPKGKGSGIPYMILTTLDYVGQDILVNGNVTLMMSLVQGRYCTLRGYDPMDPRCARVTFSGQIQPVLKNDTDYETAYQAIYGRHKHLSKIPSNDYMYLAKLNIETISVLATFGPPQDITVDEYININKDVESSAEYGNE